MGGKAAAAAEYPADLCRAICRGLMRQKRYDQEQLAASVRQGRGELKRLIAVITKGIGTKRCKSNSMVGQQRSAQADNSRVDDKANSIVKNDLMRITERASKRREMREVKTMIGIAKEKAKFGEPLKSVLKRSGIEHPRNKNATFENSRREIAPRQILNRRRFRVSIGSTRFMSPMVSIPVCSPKATTLTLSLQR